VTQEWDRIWPPLQQHPAIGIRDRSHLCSRFHGVSQSSLTRSGPRAGSLLVIAKFSIILQQRRLPTAVDYCSMCQRLFRTCLTSQAVFKDLIMTPTSRNFAISSVTRPLHSQFLESSFLENILRFNPQQDLGLQLSYASYSCVFKFMRKLIFNLVRFKFPELSRDYSSGSPRRL
jgi:hypothetical protein